MGQKVNRATVDIMHQLRSKVKVTRPLNVVTESQPYLQNRKACKSPLQGRGHIMAVALQAAQLVLFFCVSLFVVSIKKSPFSIGSL